MKYGAASLFLIASLFARCVLANEPVRQASELLAEGYRPVTYAARAERTSVAASVAPFALRWPVQFQDAEHSCGNVMAEYQPFGDPYFHGGVDMRVAPRAEVHTPVAGRLEAGPYSYVTNADGSMTKYFKPWPAEGDSTYFEVAVITPAGLRFEFHHVDRDNLPSPIVALLNAGGGDVAAGTLLGQAILWLGQDYDHIHYNIIAADGTRINPEYASTLVPDSTAPAVREVVAVYPDRHTRSFGTGVFADSPQEFVVAVTDHQDRNIYDHPPALARLQFDSGESTVWDFRQTLTAPDGKFPPLWDFFMAAISDENGVNLELDGGYGTGQSLVRLKIPAGAKGKFTLELGDIAGNVTRLAGETQR